MHASTYGIVLRFSKVCIYEFIVFIEKMFYKIKRVGGKSVLYKKKHKKKRTNKWVDKRQKKIKLKLLYKLKRSGSVGWKNLNKNHSL